MAIPDDKELEKFALLVTEILTDSEDSAHTNRSLIEMADLIDQFNEGCCGCGWASVVSAALRGGDPLKLGA